MFNRHFCRTTFVEEFINYWVKQLSGIVKVVASESATPESTTTDVTPTQVYRCFLYILINYSLKIYKIYFL